MIWSPAVFLLDDMMCLIEEISLDCWKTRKVNNLVGVWRVVFGLRRRRLISGLGDDVKDRADRLVILMVGHDVSSQLVIQSGNLKAEMVEMPWNIQVSWPRDPVLEW